jgi:hypothetical protein
VAFSFSGDFIPAGLGILVSFEFDELSENRTISLSNIIVSDTNASAMDVIVPEPTYIPACDDSDGDGMCNAIDPEPNCATNDSGHFDVFSTKVITLGIRSV